MKASVGVSFLNNIRHRLIAFSEMRRRVVGTMREKEESAMTRAVNSVFDFVRFAEFEILFFLFFFIAFILFKDLVSFSLSLSLSMFIFNTCTILDLIEFFCDEVKLETIAMKLRGCKNWRYGLDWWWAICIVFFFVNYSCILDSMSLF